MKKIISLIMAGMMIFILTACANSTERDNAVQNTEQSSIAPEEENQTETQEDSPEVPEGSEMAEPKEQSSCLVVYFSQTGNTETIAGMIAEHTGGELFHVETVTVYPDEYNDLIEVAKEEQDNDERPGLASAVEDMDRYQTVFIGFPNWWGTMPMAMFTFLESYDFAGKTVIPFCTHEGSALGRSESDIAALIPEAELQKGLAVRGSNVDSAEDDVVSWLEELGFESLADGD
ncbi:MAG: flavodoxin [Lachnospiraceae bacterium]